MNLKELKGPIQEQENNIVIWITTKQYINERLIQEIKFSNKFFFFLGEVPVPKTYVFWKI